MKKIFAKSVAVLAVALFSNVYLAAQERKAWADVAAPTITGVEKISETEYKISFNCLTNNDGADEGLVVAKSESGVTVKKVFGKTRKEAKTSTLQFERTGNYSVVVQAMRKDEAEVHNSEPKTINFKLDLAKTKLTALNIGDSTIKVTWDSVPEAEGYILSYTDESGKTVSNPVTTELSANLQLKAGTKSTLMVTTIRGSDKSVSAPIQKTVAKDAERIWRFTEFGTSTNPNRNNMEMIDADNLKVKLNSCTFDPKTKNIIDKGGKFETFFDGISFYYTVIDPHKENFELTATVTVD